MTRALVLVLGMVLAGACFQAVVSFQHPQRWPSWAVQVQAAWYLAIVLVTAGMGVAYLRSRK